MIRSCISRSGVVITAGNGQKLRALRGAAQNFGTSVSDRDNQVNFNSLEAKFSAITKLFDSTERRKFAELRKKNVLPIDNIYSAAWVYVCLQNPLLKKYSIHPEDILKGAKYGFEVTYKAMFTADLRDFALGDAKESVSNDLLADTFNTRLYEAAVGAAKDSKTKNVTSNITVLDIVNVTIRNIDTQIVPGDVPPETEYMTDEERVMYFDVLKMKDATIAAWKKDTDEASTVDSNTSKPEPVDVTTTNSATKVASAKTSASSVAAVPAKPSDSTTTTPAAAVPVAAAPVATAAPTVVSSPNSNSVSNSSNSTAAGSSAKPAVFVPQPATRAALRNKSYSPSAANATATTTTSPSADTTNRHVAKTSTPSPAPQATTSASTEASTASSAPPTQKAAVPPATDSTMPAASQVGTPTETSTGTATGTEAESEADPISTAPPEVFLSAYPPGSVVATVDVQFDIREEFETTMGGAESALSSIRHARSSAPMWTFRGCISGQVPLHWRVVAFNGLGSKNSKY